MSHSRFFKFVIYHSINLFFKYNLSKFMQFIFRSFSKLFFDRPVLVESVSQLQGLKWQRVVQLYIFTALKNEGHFWLTGTEAQFPLFCLIAFSQMSSLNAKIKKLFSNELKLVCSSFFPERAAREESRFDWKPRWKVAWIKNRKTFWRSWSFFLP